MRNTAQTFFLIILALAQALVASADAHQFHSDSERHTTSAPLEQLAVQVNLAVAEPNVKTTDQHIQCEYSHQTQNSDTNTNADCQHCCHCHTNFHAFMLPPIQPLQATLASWPAYGTPKNHLLPRNSRTPFRPPIA